MKKTFLLTLTLLLLLGSIGTAMAAPVDKSLICHKFGTPAQKTMLVPYKAAIGHAQGHGDNLGVCDLPRFDVYIDVDGIVTPARGLPLGIEIRVGDTLTAWPTGGYIEGLDMFDNDHSCTWTFGDDLHLEDRSGACNTGIRNGIHDVGADCDVLDLDGSFSPGQRVDIDLETGTTFTGCPGPDPLLMFFDTSGNGYWDNGEDIVFDGNNNGIFD